MSGNFFQNDVQTPIFSIISGDKVSFKSDLRNPSTSEICVNENVVYATDGSSVPLNSHEVNTSAINDIKTRAENMENFVKNEEDEQSKFCVYPPPSHSLEDVKSGIDMMSIKNECKKTLDNCIDVLLSLDLNKKNESIQLNHICDDITILEKKHIDISTEELRNECMSDASVLTTGDSGYTNGTISLKTENQISKDTRTSDVSSICSPAIYDIFESLFLTLDKHGNSQKSQIDAEQDKFLTVDDEKKSFSSLKAPLDIPYDNCSQPATASLNRSSRITYSKKYLLSLRYVGNAVNTPKLSNESVWMSVVPETDEDFKIFGPSKKILDTKRLADLHAEKSGGSLFFPRNNRGRYPRRGRNSRQSFTSEFERRKRRDYNENPAWYNDDVADYQLPFGGLTEMETIDTKDTFKSTSATNKDSNLCPKVKALFDTYREQRNRLGAQSSLVDETPLVPSEAVGAKKLEQIESLATKTEANEVSNESAFDRLLRMIGMNANDQRATISGKPGGPADKSVKSHTIPDLNNVPSAKTRYRDVFTAIRPFSNDGFRAKPCRFPGEDQFEEPGNSINCDAEQRYRTSLTQNTAVAPHHLHYTNPLCCDPFANSSFRPIAHPSNFQPMKKKEQFCTHHVSVSSPTCGFDKVNAPYSSSHLPSSFQRLQAFEADSYNFLPSIYSNAYHSSCGVKSSHVNSDAVNMASIGLGNSNSRQSFPLSRFRNADDQFVSVNDEEAKFVNYFKSYPNSSCALPFQFHGVPIRSESDKTFDPLQEPFFGREHGQSRRTNNFTKREFSRF